MKRREIVLVAAVASNRVIGLDGKLPWRLPEDLRRFKELTTGGTVLMGRGTWDSLPVKPLPGRRNIVLSRTMEQPAGAEVYRSAKEAVDACEGTVFVVGGSDVYAQFLPVANRMELTEVLRDFEGDASFPEVNFREWEEVSRDKRFSGDLDYDNVTYARKWP